jgi:coenzyme F420-dependent glucose-6-phosphate dehydrogenase
VSVVIGYALSSEEHEPRDLVEQAVAAEAHGFGFGVISDHFHPWISRQGSSPFVWGVLGSIAAQTKTFRIGTGVTCPTIRIHPAIVAQAVATTACLMPGRFFLGVGSGENLNEHVTGARWPAPDVRLEMLEEAIGVIRLLLAGGEQTHRGKHFQVDHARIYSLPAENVPINVAAAGGASARLAGRLGDGVVCSDPASETIDEFNKSGGIGKPRYGQLTVCWADSETEAIQTAHEIWPTGALSGRFKMELPRPSHFEEATRTVRPEDVARSIPCGPDPERHLSAIAEYVKAGFDHVYVHQVGPDQVGFMRFYEREILPNLGSLAA